MCMIVRNLSKLGRNLLKLSRARHLGVIVLLMIDSLDERPGDVAINENRCFETIGQTNTHSREDAATLHFNCAFFRVLAIPSSVL